jgi:hypothetical protein
LVEILQGIQMLWLLVLCGADVTTAFRSANLCLVQVQHVQIPRLLRSFRSAIFNIKQNKKAIETFKSHFTFEFHNLNKRLGYLLEQNIEIWPLELFLFLISGD